MNIQCLLTIGFGISVLASPLSPALAQPNNPETTTAHYFATIENDPEKLLVFLQNMPKGGDLHYHHASGGGSMAEHLIHYGQGENFCINFKDYTVYQNTHCAKQNALDNISLDSALYNKVIDMWSMRDFQAGKESGHDHFFATFAKVGALASKHEGEILAETAERAGEQNESYLELMVIPDNNASGMLGKKIGWDTDLSAFRNKLLTHGLSDIVANMQKTTDQMEAKEQTVLACGTPSAKPGCHVKIRYLYEALREQPPAQVFAELLAAFEIASKDPRFVGINLVQPEDGYISLRDYHLQMQMIGFLHQLYPTVNITLHAGELSPHSVAPDELRFHIREAVEVAHAERIGHGADVAFEANADELLKEMAQKHILVEINLSSNEFILQMKNQQHPLPLYLSYHVPVALSTDDEGIIRTTLTLEYQKAILRYHLSYFTLKELVRNSLYYSFMPGENLWQDATYHHIAPQCALDHPGSTLSQRCQQFLAKSPKAQLQWDLENRFRMFENKV